MNKEVSNRSCTDNFSDVIFFPFIVSDRPFVEPSLEVLSTRSLTDGTFVRSQNFELRLWAQDVSSMLEGSTDVVPPSEYKSHRARLSLLG